MCTGGHGYILINDRIKLKKIQKKPKKCLFFEGSDCIKKENKKTI